MQFRDRRLGRVEPHDGAIGLFNERGASVRQGEGPRRPLQQLDAKLFLQLGDLAADRGLWHAKRPRRTAEATVPHYTDEDPHCVEVIVAHSWVSLS